MKAIYSIFLILSALCFAHGIINTVTQTVGGFTLVSSTTAVASGFRVAFVTQFGSPLTQGTQYNVAVSGNTYTVTGLQTGIYSATDDGGANWRNVTTSCLVPDTPVIALDTANSDTTADVDGRLLLRLRFTEQLRYRSIAYAYSGAVAACNSNITNNVAGSKQSWTRTAGTASCTDSRTDYVQDFNHALTNCNFQRDESDTTNTVFSATIFIHTTDTGDVIRGVRYERNLQTSVTIRIAFQTNITAQTTPMQIYGSRITDSTIISQTWNPSTFVATLTLFTSVQFPYQFRNPLFTSSNPTFNTPTIVAVNNDAFVDKLGNAANQANRARCTTTDINTLANGLSNVCNQYWTITLSRNSACTGSNTLTLTGSFAIRFDVTCPHYFNGSCSVPDPKNDSIAFTTDSDNYCPVLISTQAATAHLGVFQDAAYSVPQTQFVFGTFSYFRVNVTAPILMDHVAIETVTVTSGASSFLTTGNALGTNVLFSRAFGTAATWFGVTPVTTNYALLNGVRANDALSTSPAMIVTDNQDGGTAALIKRAGTGWRWNSLTSSASGDNPTPTVVQINLRIRYRNQSTVSYPDQRLTITKVIQPHHLFADTAAVSASIGVAPGTVTGPTGNTGAASTSSSSVGMALSIVGIAAGVVGVIALVSVFTVYMLRRQRERSKEQISSIQLSSTTDLNAAASA